MLLANLKHQLKAHPSVTQQAASISQSIATQIHSILQLQLGHVLLELISELTQKQILHQLHIWATLAGLLQRK